MKLIEMLSLKGKIALLNQVVLGVTSCGEKITLQNKVVRLADDLEQLYCWEVKYQDCIKEAVEQIIKEHLL